MYKCQHILIAALIPLVSIVNLSSARADSPVVGKVTAVKGEAWISKDALLKTKAKARPDSPIHLGDFLVTNGKSEMKIVLGKKEAALHLKAGTALQINRPGGENWSLDLKQGLLLSHIRPLGTQKNRFEVRTKQGVMGVRGTTFFIKSEVGKDLFLCTCDGTIVINNQVIIIGKNHNAPRLISDGKQPLASRMKNSTKGEEHSDDEARELAKLIQ